MIRKYLARVRSFVQNRPLTTHYGVDGLLVLGAMSVAANNNNLFAQRLGAGDFQLSMLQFLPQMLNLFFIIPAGLMIGSLKNKRRFISIVLIIAGAFFAVAGTSAFIPTYAVYFFLVFLALGNVSVNGIYNLAWQSFFPEAVEDGRRNEVLTFRARMTMLVQLVMPLSVGLVLTAIPGHNGKIAAHQAFYIIAAVLLISNAIHFRKIKAVHPVEPKNISLGEMRTAARRLLANKPFILFSLAILFFHMTWHMDWTLYFIGQANYLRMNELLLSLSAIGATVAQLATLKYWSKNNLRQGVEKPLVYGMLGLALCPVAMIVGTSLPRGAGIPVFLVIHTLGHLTFANVTLNLFQCLLKVVDEEYRSFSLSIYTCMITLSNALLPVAGVALYRAFGGNLNGLRLAFSIVFVLRLMSAGLWMLWLKYKTRLPQGFIQDNSDGNG